MWLIFSMYVSRRNLYTNIGMQYLKKKKLTSVVLFNLYKHKQIDFHQMKIKHIYFDNNNLFQQGREDNWVYFVYVNLSPWSSNV